MKKNWLRTLLYISLFVLAAVIGKVVGNVCAGVPALSWLSLGVDFGVDPFTVDLAVLTFTFGTKISINLTQALLFLAAIFIGNSIKLKA